MKHIIFGLVWLAISIASTSFFAPEYKTNPWYGLVLLSGVGMIIWGIRRIFKFSAKNYPIIVGMHPVKVFFENVPDKKIREKLIKNCKHPDIEVESYSSAVSSGFPWTNTPQGSIYWSEYYHFLKRNGL